MYKLICICVLFFITTHTMDPKKSPVQRSPATQHSPVSPAQIKKALKLNPSPREGRKPTVHNDTMLQRLQGRSSQEALDSLRKKGLCE